MDPLNNNQNISHESNPLGKALVVFLILVLIAASGACGYYLGSNMKNNVELKTNEATSQTENDKESNSTTSLQTTSGEWKRASGLASFSFEYPYGWHVASRWPEDYSKPIAIWMDTDPISGAPRGGPFAKIEMSVLSGISDAEEKLNKTKEDIKKNHENVTEEIINSENGIIYHYTGTVPPGYLGGATLDEYVLKIEGQDDINDNVITLVAYDKPDLKDTLRHIAMSIKKN